MKGLLSIIVPVYKVEAYLAECLDSILAQTYANFELILVDDGSPDNCPPICDQYAQRDKRIRVIHQSNGGLSAARNTGLNNAQGEWIGFVDSDDWISPGFYEAAVSVMQAHPEVDVVELPMLQAYNTPQAHRYAPADDTIATNTKTIFSLWFSQQGYDHAFAQTKLYRRQIFEGLRFTEGKVFEDLFIIPLILKRSKGWTYTNDLRATYYYRQQSQSITATANASQLLQLLEAHIPIVEMARDACHLHKRKKQLYALYLVNRLIDYQRACRKEEIVVEHLTPIENYVRQFIPSILDLPLLPISFRSKLKNLPLSLLGLSIHIRLYA